MDFKQKISEAVPWPAMKTLSKEHKKVWMRMIVPLLVAKVIFMLDFVGTKTEPLCVMEKKNVELISNGEMETFILTREVKFPNSFLEAQNFKYERLHNRYG